MEQHRKYSAADISRLIDLLRASGDYTSDELTGTGKLADLLMFLERLDAETIDAAVKQYFGSV
jgi:hypothetical protein